MKVMSAFPEHMTAEVEALIPTLSDHQIHPPSEGIAVFVQGERLEIPYRVYYRESQLNRCIEHSGTQGHIALCLGTRHHDGHLREKCLRRIIAVESPWVVPFVIQLAGEYVVEIVQVVEQELPRLNPGMYGEYVKTNGALLRTVGRRAASYWNEYYRHKYPELRDYPGYKVVTALNRLAEP